MNNNHMDSNLKLQEVAGHELLIVAAKNKGHMIVHTVAAHRSPTVGSCKRKS
jgi:hypothetical protein